MITLALNRISIEIYFLIDEFLMHFPFTHLTIATLTSLSDDPHEAG